MSMPVTSPTTRWMSPPPVYDNRLNVPGSNNKLTPYLQLPHLLSLTWLAYPILSLIFIVFRLQISSDSAQTSIANAKDDLLASCQAAQTAGASVVSMPRYMAIATNEQISDAVNGTMNAARAALILSLTIMETIINFLVDIYRSTFLCFVELIVRGGLSVLISAVQDISDAITSTLNDLRTTIQNDVSSVNSAIQTAIDAINKVNPFDDITAPQFSIPDLDALSNVTIPTDFEDTLISLNNSLPTVSDIKNAINGLLDTPFEAVKADINNTFAGLSFNSSALPVPERATLSFCDDMDTSVVDDLGHDILQIAKIGLILVIVCIFLLLAGNCLLEWYKWRTLKQHLQYTREAWMSDPTIAHNNMDAGAPTVRLSDHNLLMLGADSAHPLITRLANQFSAFFRLKPQSHINLRWLLQYVFHPPALACFLIGFFGILSVEIQLIAIHPLEAKYQARSAAAVSDFSNTVATSVNQSMYNQSASYANDINSRVDAIQTSINDGLFGWVNGTTSTLNDSLVTFYSDVQNFVTLIFNGTILEQPAQEFVQCLIGSKVDALEEALTFLHDNLNINIAKVNESALVLSSDQVNEATQPIAAAAIGGNGSDSDGLVGKLVNAYVESLKKERIMFAVFLGLWGLVVLMGLAVIWWHSYGVEWKERRERRKWRMEQRDGIRSIVVPFKEKGGEEHGHGKSSVELPSFTPLSSPKAKEQVLEDQQRKGRSRHPLGMLRPRFEKSFDSFFDHHTPTHEQQQPNPPESHSESPPRGFLANIGRKRSTPLATPSPYTSHEDLEKSHSAEETGGPNDQRPKPSWFKSFFNFSSFSSGGESSSDPLPSSNDSIVPRRRPNLQISTSHSQESFRDDPNNNLPAIERTSPSEDSHSHVPPSAWSTSDDPGQTPKAPRTLPWLNPIAPTEPKPVPKPKPNSKAVSPPMALRPKPRRTASVPEDVGNSMIIDADSPLPPKVGGPNGQRESQQMYPQTHLPVPLYHGRPDMGRYPALVPVPKLTQEHQVRTHRPRQSFVGSALPQQPAPAPGRPLVPGPPGLQGSQRRARESYDPFSTPFDDIHEVPRNPNRASNPFGEGAVAM
ncbi:uncharacterized protein STEHIDRAFT_165567 [Stereum hirsutum FP-91666 SS1]|uniref:uncharacterized protein n=1 Tax=Stereum hirsutum (strain FP-91666) TaxID=721885 RepID=UPI000440FBE7|nr:uncharacterized protein STEHIDRAFT_165567 [Stereum hirsutum FP-91666 SS1]EIM91201.1 hypothetical protein STEHIDRAFT_165567 [Stereum hirsutum FP-91666 SS1]